MAVKTINGRKSLYVGGKYMLVNQEGHKFESELLVSVLGDLVFAIKNPDRVKRWVTLFNVINNRWTILDSLDLED